jgi:hypothetical protein
MPCPNDARKRSVTVAFRCTPAERDRIYLLSRLSGMLKQDFIMSKLEDVEIVVKPNMATYKALKDELLALTAELARLRDEGALEDTLVVRTEILLKAMEELGAEIPKNSVEVESDSIAAMSRF